MQGDKMQDYIKAVLENMPMDWLNLTTHRLDIYEEKLAKAKELQQQIRARKAKEEAAMAFENEQARKKADKELAAAKRLADEQ